MNEAARGEATLPDCVLIRTLNAMGWPRDKGFIRRKKIVSTVVLEAAVTALNELAITLGAKLPVDAIKYIIGSFRNTDWQERSFDEYLILNLDLQGVIQKLDDFRPEQAFNFIWESRATDRLGDEIEWSSLTEIHHPINERFMG
jgi:hypothetical protein